MTYHQYKMLKSKAIWGCDIVEVCSIVVNDFVLVKYNNKMMKVHIENIEFI